MKRADDHRASQEAISLIGLREVGGAIHLFPQKEAERHLMSVLCRCKPKETFAKRMYMHAEFEAGSYPAEEST